MIESGSARLGITVAETFRRKRKITSTTSTKAISIVTFTSFTDSRIDSERSNRTRSLTDGGSSFPRTGRSAFTSSATWTVFVPGWRWIASTIARSVVSWSRYHDAVLSSSTLSITRAELLEAHRGRRSGR